MLRPLSRGGLSRAVPPSSCPTVPTAVPIESRHGVSMTVLAPAAAVDDSPQGRLAAAMAGKAVVVGATLGASGKVDVSCSAGACKATTV